MDIPKPLWVDFSDGTGPHRNPALTNEEFNAGLERIRSGNVVALWQAAHDYEYEQISGSAVGLLVMGLLMGLPKCTAVRTWINNIWSLYYARKALVTHEQVAELYDFSSCGAMPYTVPELMEEVAQAQLP